MDADAWSALAAALVAAAFAATLAARTRARRPHDALWTAGLALFALASALEAAGAWRGWSEPAFRLYYAAAPLLVGLLGLGTVALAAGPRGLAAGAWVVAALGLVVVWGALATPFALDADGFPETAFDHPGRYAFLALNALGGAALVLGALAAGWRTRRPGVLLIGLGALLPFVAGAASTAGFPAARLGAQAAAAALMFAGYLLARAPASARLPGPEASA